MGLGPLRTVALVSPYFPPSTLAGVHRARHLAKHLPSAGWKPVVVCVDERDHVQKLDRELERLLPRDIEIFKVRAAPAWMARLAGIGDISLRAWFNLRRTLLRLLATRPIEAVMITGSPFYPMALAPGIAHRFKVPVILDFQDPWLSAHGRAEPVMSKADLVQRLAGMLEPRTVNAASFITSVSEVQNAQMRMRYPRLDESQMAAIPIGGDPDDFATLRECGSASKVLKGPAGGIQLSYVGTCLPRSRELLRTLFRAFARLRATKPALAEKIQLNFIGTSNQPDDTATYNVRPIAEAEGVAEAVKEIPQRVAYLQALSWLAGSQGLLLIGSDEPHYTGSKIYPALMSGSPFLSLFHSMSSSHAVLSSAGGGHTLAFSTPEELAALEAPLADGLCILATRPETLGTADPDAYSAYTARAVARRFGDVFESVTSMQGASAS